MQELIADKAFTIDTTSEVVSEECFQERTFISIINTSTGGQIISLAFGKEAASLSGVVLYPGGFYSESRDGINKISQKQIQAISSAASGTIAIQERILMRGG